MTLSKDSKDNGSDGERHALQEDSASGVELGVNAVVGAALALLGGLSLPLAAATGAGALIARPIGKLLNALATDEVRRLETYVNETLHGTRFDFEGASDTFEALAGNPVARNTIMAGIRKLQEVLDDAAVPALGRLGRMYLSTDMPPDAFFRRCSRLLVDMSGHEMTLLADFAAWCSTLEDTEEPIEAIVLPAREASVAQHKVQVTRLSAGTQFGLPHGRAKHERPCQPELVDVFEALKRVGLGFDNPGGVVNSYSAPEVLRVGRNTVARLAQVCRG